MMDNQNAIEVRNLSKSFKIFHEQRSTLYDHLVGRIRRGNSYEKLNILDDISFDVKKGEMIGIIGKNGEGKTTLLRLLTKIYRPDTGTIKINGSIIPFLELGSGFQPELTAVDNIILYGILLGFTRRQIKEKIPAILEYGELEKFSDTKLKHFSSGMYARLAFSTAIQVNPDILLIDEVLSVGDVPFQEKSFQTFLSFKKQGKTIVFVTHSLSNITRLCDRAIFLNQGKIHTIGKPNTVVNAFYRLVEKKIFTNTGETVSITRRLSPMGIAINNSTNRIFVANLSADIVSVIDGHTNEVLKQISVGGSPRKLTVDEQRNLVYVVNRDSNTVSVINGVTNEVITNILVGERPRGIAINPDTKRIYISNRDSDTISVIDSASNKLVGEISVGAGPNGITLSKKNNKIYVALSESDHLVAIDGKLNKIIATIPVGRFPISAVINERNDLIYVTNRDSNDISVIDSKTNLTVQSIEVQNGPVGLDLNPLTNEIYVCNSGSNTVSKIDCFKNKVKNTITVGNFPAETTTSPNTNIIYVTNESGDSVTVIDGRNDKIATTINLSQKMYEL